MAKQLKLVVDLYGNSRDDAVSKFDFVRTVVGNLNEIKSDDALSLVDCLGQLVTLWKRDMDKRFDIANFFLALYRKDGSSKVNDNMILAQLAEIMGEYHLARAESPDNRVVLQGQDLVLQPLDDYLLAMHFVTFGVDRREHTRYVVPFNAEGESTAAVGEEDAFELAKQQHIKRLSKRQKQIQALFFLKYFDTIFDSRENQIVSDVTSLRKMTGQLERMGDLLVAEFPLKGHKCYELIVKVASHNRAKFSDQEKHDLTSRVLEKLGGETGISVALEEEDYQLDKKRLCNLRDELKDIDLDSTSATLFGAWSEGMYELLFTLIANIVEMIGPAPSGAEFCAMVFGSLARREACPFSDVEMCFIYRSTSAIVAQNATNYIKVLSRLLDLAVIAMGETAPPLMANQGDQLQLIHGGFQFDGNFNPSRNSNSMILSVDKLIAELPSYDLIQCNLFFNANFAYGTKSVFEDFKERLSDGSVFGEDDIERLFKEFLQDGIKEFIGHAAERNHMKDHIKLLNTILGQLCFRYQISEPSNISRINNLHGANPSKLHSSLRTVLLDLISWMTNVRCKVHLHYGGEVEDFDLDVSFEGGGGNANHYVLTDYDRKCFDRYVSHIQPLLIRLAKSAYSDEEANGNTSTFEELVEDDLRILAEYWVLRGEDEIAIYRKYQHRSLGERIEYSGIDDAHLLRANLFFEYAALASDAGCQEAFQKHTISKFVKVDEKTGVSSIQAVYNDEYLKTNSETYGRSKVRQLAGEIHIKDFPELPGVEYLASELAHQLTGYTCSYSILHKFDNNKPVMLSKTVVGTNLQDVLHQNPHFLETELDPESFSFHFIRTLILSPEDDKPDNFLVQHSGSNTSDGRKKLVCVDNDHSFAVPIMRGNIYNELVVKSIIYCSGKMKDMIHPSVVEVIKRWNPEQIVQQWIESAIKQDKHYCTLFPKDAWLQANPLASETRCAIPLTIEKNLAVGIFIKMKVLQTLLSASEDITHLDVLEKLEPDLARQYYGRVLQDEKLDTTEKRFTALTKSLYKVVDSRRRSQTNTNRMLQSSLGKIPTEKEIKERKNSTPIEMKETFEKNFPSGWVERAKVIQKEIIETGNDKSFLELQNDTLREEVISGVWFSSYGRSLITGFNFAEMDENAQNNVLTLLEKRPNTFINLSLKKCSILTDDRLLRILKRSPDLVNIDIRGCVRLTPAILPEIEKLYENRNLRQCLNNLEDIARGMDAVEVTYRLVTGDETVTDDELLHCIKDETLEEDFRNQVMRFTALRLFESRITDKTKIVELLEAAGKHAFSNGAGGSGAESAGTAAPATGRVNETVLLIFLGAVKSVDIDVVLLKEYARVALAAKESYWSSTAAASDDFLAEKQIVRMSLMLILCVNAELENALKDSLANAFTSVCDESFINSPEAIHSILALICHSARPLPMSFVTHCVDHWMKRMQSAATTATPTDATTGVSAEASQKIVTFCVHILLFYPGLSDEIFSKLLRLTGQQSFSFEHFHALTSIREASFDDIERFVKRAMSVKEQLGDEDTPIVLAIGLIFAMILMTFTRASLIGPMCLLVANAFMLSVKTGSSSSSLLLIILSIWLKKILNAKDDVIDTDSWVAIANFLLLAPPTSNNTTAEVAASSTPVKGGKGAAPATGGPEDDILFAIGLRAGIEYQIVPAGGEMLYLERLERLAGRILQRGGDSEEDCVEILEAVWTFVVHRGKECSKEIWALIEKILCHCVACYQGRDSQPVLAAQFLHIVLAILQLELTPVPFALETYFHAASPDDKSSSTASSTNAVSNALLQLFGRETDKKQTQSQWEKKTRFCDYILRRMKWSPVLSDNMRVSFAEKLVANVTNYDDSDWSADNIDHLGNRDAVNLAVLAHKLDNNLVIKLLEDVINVVKNSVSQDASVKEAHQLRRTQCLSSIVAILRSLNSSSASPLTSAHIQLLVKFLLNRVESETHSPAKHNCLVALCLMVEKDMLSDQEALVKEVLQCLLETRVAGKYIFADMTEAQRDEVLSLHEESVIKKLQAMLNRS